jgi:hypothetical protein
MSAEIGRLNGEIAAYKNKQNKKGMFKKKINKEWLFAIVLVVVIIIVDSILIVTGW